jgi:hypothetical protein
VSVGALGGWSGPVRVVLLAAVAVGVVQMHVFGHAAGGHGQGGGDSTAVHVIMAPPPAPGQAMPEPSWPLPSLDVLAVCLAVLTSIVVAGLVALFTRGPRRGLAGLRRGSLPRGCSVRGPPVLAVLVGRRLAAQSVLRI